MYQPAIDLDAVTAIDVHVHIEIDEHGHNSLPDDLVAAVSKYFKADGPRPAIEAVARYYRERQMAAVVFTVDARTQLAHQPLSSVEIARAAAEHADVLIPFGSVDPRTGRRARPRRPADRGRGRTRLQVPSHRAGLRSERRAVRPAVGSAGEGRRAGAVPHRTDRHRCGMPGGYGFRLGLSNPMLLDPVAAEFPDLQIIMAHPSVPWQDEALSVATHKPNTWIDLSGWSPKYFPAELVRYANSLLKRRVLFGTDYPLLTPDRWLRDVRGTDLKPEVLPGILKDNAVRLLGLSS